MNRLPRSVEKAATVFGRTFGRMTFIAIGLAMMIVGLAMMVTIVLLPTGVIVGALGVAALLAGLFVPVPRDQ